jgi:hypothetical protein
VQRSNIDESEQKHGIKIYHNAQVFHHPTDQLVFETGCIETIYSSYRSFLSLLCNYSCGFKANTDMVR